MRLARVLPLAAAALLAACADTPTAPLAAPGGPSLEDGIVIFIGSGGMNSTTEGGNFFGSGNYSDPTGSGETSTSTDSTSTETERGLNTMGSGN